MTNQVLRIIRNIQPKSLVLILCSAPPTLSENFTGELWSEETLLRYADYSCLDTANL